MKKIMLLVMFALVFAQMVNTAHAFSDTLYQSDEISVVTEKELANTSEETVEQHALQNHHCHMHLYTTPTISGFFTHQLESLTFSRINQTLLGLVHGPDSPPPNFS